MTDDSGAMADDARPHVDEAEAHALDYLLQQVVELINQNPGIELPVRLEVNGAVISGIIISGSAYFREQSEKVLGEQKAPTEDMRTVTLGQALYTRFQSLAASYDSEDAFTDTVTAHVHLRDASLFIPGERPLALGLWRARLVNIGGWSLGTYVAAD